MLLSAESDGSQPAAEGEHYGDNFTEFKQSWLLMRGNDWERVRASKGIQLFLNVLLTWQEKKKNPSEKP